MVQQLLFFFNITVKALVIKESDIPTAHFAKVFIEQGRIIILSTLNEPDAILAPIFESLKLVMFSYSSNSLFTDILFSKNFKNCFALLENTTNTSIYFWYLFYKINPKIRATSSWNCNSYFQEKPLIFIYENDNSKKNFQINLNSFFLK